MRQRGVLLSLLALACASHAAATLAPGVRQVQPGDFSGNAVVLTFETAPDGSPLTSGTPLRDVYLSLGVRFGADDLVLDRTGVNIATPPNVVGDPECCGVYDV